MPLFTSPDDVRDRLAATGYLADDAIATTVFLADALGKPLLVEGPAGTGKTELAKAVATAAGAELVRLQCYEGLDEARALYEWNYRKQLLRIQAAGDQAWEETHDDIFSEEFLLSRPLLTAIRRTEPTVLLVDETDKADVEVEGLLLEVLSDFQVTIPELGTIEAVRKPFVVLTSNATRELSEALKRRCLFLHVDYPDAEREKADRPHAACPRSSRTLAEQLVRTIRTLRALELKKAPSIAESIDWARTLVALGLDTLDEEAVAQHARRRAQALLRPRTRHQGAGAQLMCRRRRPTRRATGRRSARPARVVRGRAARGRAAGVDGGVARRRPRGHDDRHARPRAAACGVRRHAWSSTRRTARRSTGCSTCGGRRRSVTASRDARRRRRGADDARRGRPGRPRRDAQRAARPAPRRAALR